MKVYTYGEVEFVESCQHKGISYEPAGQVPEWSMSVIHGAPSIILVRAVDLFELLHAIRHFERVFAIGVVDQRGGTVYCKNAYVVGDYFRENPPFVSILEGFQCSWWWDLFVRGIKNPMKYNGRKDDPGW